MTSHEYGARTVGLLPEQCVGSGRVPKARADPTSIAIASRRVLIVEDHPLVGEAMRDVLARSADDLDPHIRARITRRRRLQPRPLPRHAGRLSRSRRVS